MQPVGQFVGKKKQSGLVNPCWLTDLFTSLSKTPSIDLIFLKFVQIFVPQKSLHPIVDKCLSRAVSQILEY